MSMDELKRRGMELRRKREDLGMSRAEVAEKIGVAERTLGNIETGAQRPGEAVIMKLEQLYAPAECSYGEDSPPANEAMKESRTYIRNQLSITDLEEHFRVIAEIIDRPDFEAKVKSVELLVGDQFPRSVAIYYHIRMEYEKLLNKGELNGAKDV